MIDAGNDAGNDTGNDTEMTPETGSAYVLSVGGGTCGDGDVCLDLVPVVDPADVWVTIGRSANCRND